MSDDLIKREDAIKAIKQWRDNDGSLFDVGLNQAIREIKRLPSADRPQEWIPCSERLPNENEWVLCSCNNGFAILILKLKGKVWHKTEAVEYLPKFVNAWMPLPKPWEGADNEKST